MGFGARLVLDTVFDMATGKVCFFKVMKKEFDMSLVPVIPEEYKEFVEVCGWHWSAYVPYGTLDGDWYLNDMPSYEEVRDNEYMIEADEEDKHDEAEYNKFNGFIEWLKATGITFYYHTWC
jgi:hypothetical protein